MASLRRRSNRPTNPEAARKAELVARKIIREGSTVLEAMTAAGYSPKQAKKGFSEMKKRPAMQEAFAAEMNSAMASVKTLPSAEARENLIRWRLVENILTGKDRAVGSCKLAGQDKQVNLYQSESMSGVIVITPPAGLRMPDVDADE